LYKTKITVLKNITFDSQEEFNELAKQLTELESIEKGLQSMPGYSELTNKQKGKILTDLYVAKAMELAAKNRGLGKNDPGFIEAERLRQEVLDSIKAPEKGEIPTQPELQKPKANAVQEPSTTEVLPSQQSEVRETGRKRQGVEPSVQGEEVAQEGGKEEVAQQYLDNINKAKAERPKKYWSVSVPEKQDVIDGTIVETEGGQAIVDKTGDIRGVFKYIGSKEENTGDKLVQKAIAAGGIKLDNFALDNLMDIYQRNGFRVVARVEFNEEFAPEGWNKREHGTPDVVAMIYDPEGKLDIEEKQFTKDEYYDALEYQNSFIDAQKQAYPQTESNVDTKAQEERKSIADKVRSLKSEGGKAYSAGLGIPVAIWDGAVELIATSIEAGESFVNAINKAKEYLKQQLGDDYNEDTVEEFMDRGY
jgi:ribosomal protein L10